jgi:hypothetical protein
MRVQQHPLLESAVGMYVKRQVETPLVENFPSADIT